jgi:NAD dependent epimerase/dehydratase
MANIDTVMHLAALISIPYSYLAPRSYIETNVVGTLNILQAARDNGANVIHTSTSEVYGTATYVPMDESHSLIGQSPYSASKIAADQLAYSFYSSFGLPVQIIRPFNTYGPRQSNRAVIPSIINQILSGKREIKLGSLTPTRDFNFVDDTVNGFIKSLDNKSVFGEVINLGSGFEISIGQLVNLIAEVMKVDITVNEDSTKIRPETSEVFRLFSSNEKAQKILGWQPKFGGVKGLKRGLEKSICWYSKVAKNDTNQQNINFV